MALNNTGKNPSKKKVIVEKQNTASKKQPVKRANSGNSAVNKGIPVRGSSVRNSIPKREDKTETEITELSPEELEAQKERLLEEKERRRKKEKLRRIISIISAVVCVLSFAYFTYYVLKANNTSVEADALAELKKSENNIFKDKKKDNSGSDTGSDIDIPDILDEYKTVYAKNKSLAGWIKIEGTEIDYPVMQTRNNDYYLNHDFEQNEDNNGSIFIDCDCSIYPRSQNLIIYGHNMKSGKMFGSLNKYKDEAFFREHPIIYFDTIYEKGKYKIMYVFPENVHEAMEVTFKYYEFIDAASEAEYDSNMQTMSEMSLYDTGVTSHYGDKLITLSTCDYREGAERFAVVAKKID
ncbi:MAG: class B sortase [Lachnospiraceae bacterium]|nr:class B sortase [Lachnospiraceae bacterium]